MKSAEIATVRTSSTTVANALLALLACALLARSEADLRAPVDDWSRLARSVTGADVLLGAEMVGDFHFLVAPPQAVPTAVQREASPFESSRYAGAFSVAFSESGAPGRHRVVSSSTVSGTDAPRALYVLHAAYLL